MMKLILLCSLGIVVLSGCSDDYLLDRKEDKLIGTWEFEKAFYKSDRALFRDNITNEYQDDLMIFYGDYAADYVDYSLNTVFPGEWRILLDRDIYYTEDGSSGGVEFFIDALFYDAMQGEDFAFFGSIDRLNNNRLQFEARDRDGTYTFKLCKRY
jgi:hypothetical protein